MCRIPVPSRALGLHTQCFCELEGRTVAVGSVLVVAVRYEQVQDPVVGFVQREHHRLVRQQSLQRVFVPIVEEDPFVFVFVFFLEPEEVAVLQMRAVQQEPEFAEWVHHRALPFHRLLSGLEGLRLASDLVSRFRVESCLLQLREVES